MIQQRIVQLIQLDRETCNEQMCTSWSFGEWSECSVSCGEGKQTRDAICIDGEGRTLDTCESMSQLLHVCVLILCCLARCNYKERIIHKPCYKSKCESWKVGEWTSCSVSCQVGEIFTSFIIIFCSTENPFIVFVSNQKKACLLKYFFKKFPILIIFSKFCVFSYSFIQKIISFPNCQVSLPYYQIQLFDVRMVGQLVVFLALMEMEGMWT